MSDIGWFCLTAIAAMAAFCFVCWLAARRR
jgi:hypothetical protein